MALNKGGTGILIGLLIFIIAAILLDAWRRDD
jgi:hypothetical protein